MRIPGVGLFATVLVALVALVSCNSILGNQDNYLLSAEGGTCRLNSECRTGNFCIFQTCGRECNGDVDCASGLRCLQTDTGTACVAATVALCSAGCPAGTACSEAEGVCRNACDTAQCLTGQTCTAGWCVGTGDHESTPDGGLNDAGSDADAGSSAVCTEKDTRPCSRDGALGNCAKGTETCQGGAWSACSVRPATADSCATQGDDANCNGMPNDHCPCVTGDTQACGPDAVGVCAPGTATCVGGQWGDCVGAVTAGARDCSSAADNDCDGTPDDTIDSVCQCAIGKSVACGAHAGYDGKGRCKPGTAACTAGANNATSTLGACLGSVGPATTDTCDTGNDDDCNGTANDSCVCINGTTGTCGTKLGAKGACAAGAVTCAAGKWSACPINAAAADTCVQGNDATCNGTANEGCRYVTVSSSVVLDTTTGLNWQQNEALLQYSVNDAMSYCAGLGVGWRLPTLTELESIVLASATPKIDSTVFSATLMYPYAHATWTSSSSASVTGQTTNWSIHFNDGNEDEGFYTSTQLEVRCVK